MAVTPTLQGASVRWQVTLEDKRGIKTIYREFCDSRDLARDRAIQRYTQAHPEMGDVGEDWWVHRIESVDAPDIGGAPA